MTPSTEFSPSKQGPIAKQAGHSDKNPDGQGDLYILKLNGNLTSILGVNDTELNGHLVIKAGLSKNAQRRCDTLNRTILGDQYYWEVLYSTSSNFNWQFPNGEAAKTEERKLQFMLQEPNDAKSLGGEFFRAHPEDIHNAWMRLHLGYDRNSNRGKGNNYG